VATRPGGDGDPNERRSREWERHPGLSRAVRVGVFAGPVVASFGVAVLLGHLLPRTTSLAPHLLGVGIIGGASLLTLFGVERATRRLLPLAALLNLSLAFPDKAPARFAIARRAGRPSELRASLQRANEGGRTDDARRLQTVIELVLALSVHDRASRGHSERVRVFTDLLADELKVPESGRNRLRWAALLHDIGKLEVSPAILNKPAKPSAEEWAVLHRHPEEGARLVAPLLPWLAEWGLAVEQHHERFDGTGYPRGLRGHEIALAARIVSVADVYEVMTAPRTYKRPMSVSAARKELVRVAGTQLDPTIVRAFLNIAVGRLWRTIGFGAWIGQIPTLGRLISFWGSAASGMGVATAVTATVLTVGGFAGPVPSPTDTPVHGPAVAVASGNGASASSGPSLPAPTGAGAGPNRASGSPAPATLPVSAPASPGASSSAPGSPSPSPSGPRPPAPTPTASPSTSPTPTPPTPSPTPLPATCSACTNTSPGCTSYCNLNNTAFCVTWCQGNNNTACTSYCWGNHDTACISDCTGSSHNACVSNCQLVFLLPRPVVIDVRALIFASVDTPKAREWRLPI
jgi:hypothetical protein